MELDIFILYETETESKAVSFSLLTVKDEFEEIGIDRRRRQGALNFDYFLAAKKIYGEKYSHFFLDFCLFSITNIINNYR